MGQPGRIPRKSRQHGQEGRWHIPLGPERLLVPSVDMRRQPALPSAPERPRCRRLSHHGWAGMPLPTWPRAQVCRFPRAAGGRSSPAVRRWPLCGHPSAGRAPSAPAAAGTGTRQSRHRAMVRGAAGAGGLLAGGHRAGNRVPSEGASGGGRRRSPGLELREGARSSGGGSPPGTAPCPRPGRGGGSLSPLLGGCGSAGAAGDRRCRRGPGAASARAGSAPAPRRSQRGIPEEEEDGDEDEHERGAAGSGAGCR